MPGPGVTLHLSLPTDVSDPAAAAATLDRRVSAWVRALADSGRPARLLVATRPAVPADVLDAGRHLCKGAGVDLVDSPDDSDVVILANATDLPGPYLVARLVDAVTGGDAVVDARTLPIDLSVREAAKSIPGTARMVAGACIAMSASRWAELGSATGSELLEGLERAGLTPVFRPEATVWRDVRVDSEGAILPRRTFLPPVPSWDESAPPSGHPAALPASTLGAVAAAAGLQVPEPDRTDRPFLSIVTRTQGLRPQPLEEMLTCLVAQTSRDFEVVLVCHQVSTDAMTGITAGVEGQPDWLRQRIRVIPSDRPGRAAPLNDGFVAAEGRYVVALDDDDTVFAHWVETFRETEQTAPGTVLRAGALRQDVAPFELATQHGPAMCPVSVGPAFPDWPLDFSMIDHLRANYSPFMTWAFPRGVVHDLGLRFDETLPTTEDWHFLVRAAAVVGVTDARELTSVYRWWTTEGSRALHDEAEWERGHEAVRRSFDEQIIVLPPGSAHVFTDMHRERDEAWAKVSAAATSRQEVIEQLDEVVAAYTAEVACRDAYQATLEQLEARISERQTRNDEPREQQEGRLELMREAHALLANKGDEVPGGRSLFDLNRKELRQLIQRLSRKADCGRAGSSATDGRAASGVLGQDGSP